MDAHWPSPPASPPVSPGESYGHVGHRGLSPKRRRVRLYFQLHAKNIRDAEVCAFLRHLLKNLRGRMVLIWTTPPFTGEAGSAGCYTANRLLHRHPRLRLEALSGYALELNPDEGVWQHAKRELANGQPDTGGESLSAIYALNNEAEKRSRPAGRRSVS